MRISDWSSDVCSSDLAEDRISAPEVKRNGQWQATTWEDALQFAGETLKKAPGSELGILLHPATSNEEGDLLMRLARGLGSAHVDHRLRQLDFADNAVAQPFTLPVADRSEEHTSELQSLMRISYAVFCLKKKTKNKT